MALAGLCFAIYPIFLGRSRLPGNLAAGLFTLVVFLCIVPFAYSQRAEMANTFWLMVIGAGMFSAVGMMLMTGVITQVPKQKLGTLVVYASIFQISATACYQFFMDGKVTFTKCAGFVCAGIAIVLLSKK